MMVWKTGKRRFSQKGRGRESPGKNKKAVSPLRPKLKYARKKFMDVVLQDLAFLNPCQLSGAINSDYRKACQLANFC
jgi:hypothetical protein